MLKAQGAGGVCSPHCRPPGALTWGTQRGDTKLVASMTGSPVWDSMSISPIFTAVGTMLCGQTGGSAGEGATRGGVSAVPGARRYLLVLQPVAGPDLHHLHTGREGAGGRGADLGAGTGAA